MFGYELNAEKQQKRVKACRIVPKHWQGKSLCPSSTCVTKVRLKWFGSTIFDVSVLPPQHIIIFKQKSETATFTIFTGDLIAVPKAIF